MGAIKELRMSIDMDNKAALASISKLELELRKLGDFSQRNLKQIGQELKGGINIDGHLKDLKTYQYQIEGILAKMRSGEIKVDYKQLSFLNNELSKTNSLIKTYDKDMQVAEKRTGNLMNALKNTAVFVALAAGLRMLSQAAGGWIREAVDQAKANIQLEQSLKKVGLSTDETIKKIKELSQRTAVDDDDIKKAYSYGVALGVPASRLGEFVEIAIDFSAATGKGLEASLKAVTDEAKKGGKAWDDLKKSVSGQAAAAADADGGLNRVKLALQDVSGELGRVLIAVLRPILETVLKLINAWNNWDSPLKKVVTQFVAIGTVVATVVGGMGALNMATGGAFASLSALLLTNPAGWALAAAAAIIALTTALNSYQKELAKAAATTEDFISMQRRGSTSDIRTKFNALSVDQKTRVLDTITENKKWAASGIRDSFATFGDGMRVENIVNESWKIKALIDKLQKNGYSDDAALLKENYEMYLEYSALDTTLRNAMKNVGNKPPDSALPRLPGDRDRKDAPKDMTQYVKQYKQALSEAQEALQELANRQAVTFGGAVVDSYAQKLSGLVGGISKLSSAVDAFFSQDSGVEANKGRMGAIRKEIDSLTAVVADEGTLTKSSARLQELKTQLNQLASANDAMTTSMAASVVAVIDLLAGAVLQFWNSYDQTLEKLDTSILSEGRKSSMAIEEAFEGSINSLLTQFGAIGQIAAKIVDQLWETDSEKRDAALKRIGDQTSALEHEISRGRIESIQEQVSGYEKILSQLKAAGADQDEIWKIEEKILSLKEKATEEARKQLEYAKTRMNLEAGLYGRTPAAQIEYYKSELERLKNQRAGLTTQDASGYLSERSGLLDQRGGLQNKLNELQAKWNDMVKWKMVTPEQAFKDIENLIRLTQGELDRIDSQIRVKDVLINAINANNADLTNKDRLIAEAEAQMKLLQAEKLRYDMELFEHEMNLSRATEDEKNKMRLDKYQDFLKQAAGLNEYLDTQIRDNLDKLKNAVAGSDQYYAIQAEIQALNEKRISEQDIWSIEERIAAIQEQKLDMMEAQTREMERQKGLLNDQIGRLIAAGVLDPENIIQSRSIQYLAASKGLSGSDIYDVVSGNKLAGPGMAAVQSIDKQIDNLTININAAPESAIRSAISADLDRLL